MCIIISKGYDDIILNIQEWILKTNQVTKRNLQGQYTGQPNS